MIGKSCELGELSDLVDLYFATSSLTAHRLETKSEMSRPATNILGLSLQRISRFKLLNYNTEIFHVLIQCNYVTKQNIRILGYKYFCVYLINCIV